MISGSDPSFPNSRTIAFSRYDPQDERRRESLFGLGNGLLFMRASLSAHRRPDALHYPGTYRAGCYDRCIRDADGTSFCHDSLVNLPDMSHLTFRIQGDESWFDLTQVALLDYRHTLDMNAGLAERRLLVRDAKGRRTQIVERRLVSMAEPRLVAMRLELTAQNWAGPVEIHASVPTLVANGNTDRTLEPYRHLEIDQPTEQEGVTLLCGHTRHSHVTIATASRFTPRRIEMILGKPATAEKVAAIVTSRDPATSDPAEKALELVRGAGDFASLAQAHRRAWDRLWQRAGIEIASPVVARGMGFHIFQLLQTVSPHSAHMDVGLPSRGWQEAYHGQIFWDEVFAFPFLNHRFPEIARSLLLYRYRRLPEAKRAAREAGYQGAMFPWRSATTGAEETPAYEFNSLGAGWGKDDTQLQRHIGAIVSHNAWHYFRATGDAVFLAEFGAELLVEIARFWASIAREHPKDRRFDITGIIGPDEYHAAYPGADKPGIDNNAYTNVMAAASLMRGVEAMASLAPGARAELMAALNLTQAELDRWRHIAQHLRLCFVEEGVIAQFQGYQDLKPFDQARFKAGHPGKRIDLWLESENDTADAYQIGKQPDVLMLLYLFRPEQLIELVGFMGYEITWESLARTARHYLDRTAHESSLSRLVCAGALAALDPATSWEHFEQALCIDFLAANSALAEEGLHLGAMAGTLDVLQRHYLGLHVEAEAIRLEPLPPRDLGPVTMRLDHRGQALMLAWDGRQVTLSADAGNSDAVAVVTDRLHMLGAGERLSVTPS